MPVAPLSTAVGSAASALCSMLSLPYGLISQPHLPSEWLGQGLPAGRQRARGHIEPARAGAAGAGGKGHVDARNA